MLRATLLQGFGLVRQLNRGISRRITVCDYRGEDGLLIRVFAQLLGMFSLGCGTALCLAKGIPSLSSMSAQTIAKHGCQSVPHRGVNVVGRFHLRSGKTLTAMLGGMLALIFSAGSCVADPVDVLIARGAPSEEIAYEKSRAESQRVYSECLVAEKGTWLSAPDYGKCDAARDALAQYLPRDATAIIIGCLEEGAVGASRSAENTCEEFDKRFTRLDRLRGIAPSASEEAAP